MRTRRPALALATTLAMLALGACGDDSSTTSGGTGGGGGGVASTTSSGTTTPTSTTSTTSTSTSDGGGTGEGAASGSGGEGGATGGAGAGGEGGAAEGGSTGAGGQTFEDFVPFWENVAFPEDAGRLELEPFVGLTLQVRAAGTEDVLFDMPDTALPAGFLVHAYTVGRAEEGTFDAFIVQDNDDFELPDPGDGNIRLAHFAPDLPAVDLYLNDGDLIYGPLLDTDQFTFPTMSSYGSFPSETYEGIVVLTGDDPFLDPIGSFPGLEVVEGETQTLALIGAGDDFELALYADDMTEPEDGSAAVTFVHLAPEGANVDAGLILPIN